MRCKAIPLGGVHWRQQKLSVAAYMTHDALIRYGSGWKTAKQPTITLDAGKEQKPHFLAVW
jgi:hypothetical protein